MCDKVQHCNVILVQGTLLKWHKCLIFGTVRSTALRGGSITSATKHSILVPVCLTGLVIIASHNVLEILIMLRS